MPRIYPIFILLLLHSHLESAVVQQVVGKASSPVHTVLKDGQNFATGTRSKSQVALDKGFFRVGSDAGVKVVTSNNLSLEKGIMLVGSAPARFRRPAITVNAPGYKMEIKGTAQIAYYPGYYVKITVLEGKVRVALQSLTGEWETLEPGQMLIISPSDKRLPEPVEVDIGRLAATSQLIGGAFSDLSTQSLINAAASSQGSAFVAGNLAQTPFRLLGASPETSIDRPNAPKEKENRNGIRRDEITNFNLINDLDDPTATVKERLFSNGQSFSLFPRTGVPGDSNTSRRGSKTEKLTIGLGISVDEFGQYTGPPIVDGRIRIHPDVFGGKNRALEIQSSDTVSSITDDYTLYVRPGSDIETPSGVALNIIGDVGLNIQGTRLQAGSGKLTNESLLLTARSRDLTITNSRLKGGDVTLTGSTRVPSETEQAITVDSTRITAHRNVKIGHADKRTFIALQNSTQLSVLVGSITVQSKGGPISVDTSSLIAGDTLTLDSLTPSTLIGSPISVTNSTFSADIIRARGYAAAGDALLIDGSTFNAASLLKLYAAGTSTLRFRNQVQLNTPLAILAGKTIAVDPGGAVQISGQGKIHTDNAQFNIPGQGTINAAGGLIRKSHATRPGF